MADPTTREADRIRSYFGETTWRTSGGREMLVAEDRLCGTEIIAERAEAARHSMPRASIARAEDFEIPFAEYPLAGFLPPLDVALKLPAALRSALVGLLPRTHRLWTWTREA